MPLCGTSDSCDRSSLVPLHFFALRLLRPFWVSSFRAMPGSVSCLGMCRWTTSWIPMARMTCRQTSDFELVSCTQVASPLCAKILKHCTFTNTDVSSTHALQDSSWQAQVHMVHFTGRQNHLDLCVCTCQHSLICSSIHLLATIPWLLQEFRSDCLTKRAYVVRLHKENWCNLVRRRSENLASSLIRSHAEHLFVFSFTSWL